MLARQAGLQHELEVRVVTRTLRKDDVVSSFLVTSSEQCFLFFESPQEVSFLDRGVLLSICLGCDVTPPLHRAGQKPAAERSRRGGGKRSGSRAGTFFTSTQKGKAHPRIEGRPSLRMLACLTLLGCFSALHDIRRRPHASRMANRNH